MLWGVLRPGLAWAMRGVGGVQGKGGAAVVARGLLQHEAKLTVLNFGVKKAAGYEEALPSKTELLLVTGLRCGCSGDCSGLWPAPQVFSNLSTHK